MYSSRNNIKELRKKREILREINHRQSEINKHMRTLIKKKERYNILVSKDIKNSEEILEISNYKSAERQLKTRILYLQNRIKELNKRNRK